MAFREEIGRISKNVAGYTFWLKKTVTSSAILTTSVDITGPAIGGELAIEDIVIKSDSTGLATGTTFRIVSDNSKGTTTVFLTRISKLGANKQTSMLREYDDPVNDIPTLGVNVPLILEQGKKLSTRNTDAASTGAGTIDIYIKFRKVSDSSRITTA